MESLAPLLGVRPYPTRTRCATLPWEAACKALELTHPPVSKSLRRLEEMGIVREMTGRQRGRL